MTKALPGEFRLVGRRATDGSTRVVACAGEGVPPEAAQYLEAYLTKPLWTILHRYGSAEPPQKAFVDDLAARGYDIASLRLSVFLASAQRAIPKRIRLIEQRPGVLQSRWARVPFDSPDLCTSWHVPCSRRDSNLLLSLLSRPAYTASELGCWANKDAGLLEELTQRGFDKRTFKFSIRHGDALEAEPAPVPAEAAA